MKDACSINVLKKPLQKKTLGTIILNVQDQDRKIVDYSFFRIINSVFNQREISVNFVFY